MTLTERFYLLLADAMLVVHFGIVVFVVGSLLLIWIGRLGGWKWVRSFWFRATHLAIIGVVALQSLTDRVCPLTTWENQLRLLAGGEERYEASFIRYWLHRMLFFDFNEAIFTTVYVGFFLLVALTLWFVPPRQPGRFRTP